MDNQARRAARLAGAAAAGAALAAGHQVQQVAPQINAAQQRRAQEVALELLAYAARAEAADAALPHGIANAAATREAVYAEALAAAKRHTEALEGKAAGEMKVPEGPGLQGGRFRRTRKTKKYKRRRV